MQKKLCPKDVFDKLRAIVDIPPNARKVTLVVEIGQPVTATTECIGVEPEAGKPETPATPEAFEEMFRSLWRNG